MINLTDFYYDLISGNYFNNDDKAKRGYFVCRIVAEIESVIYDRRRADGITAGLEYTWLEEVVSLFNELMSTANDNALRFAGIESYNSAVCAEWFEDNDLFMYVVDSLEDDEIMVDYAIYGDDEDDE